MKATFPISQLARQLACALILLAAGLGTLRAAAVEAIARTVQGDAFYITPSGTKHDLLSGQVIPTGSEVETADNAFVGLELVPGATTVLSQNTDLTLTSLHFTTESDGTKERKVALKLKNGSLFSSLAKKDGDSDFKVTTPYGVAAARGTDWSINISNGVMTVQTASGVVSFTMTTPGGGSRTTSVGSHNQCNSSSGTVTGLSDSQLANIVRAIEQAGFSCSTTITDSNGKIISHSSTKTSSKGASVIYSAKLAEGDVSGGKEVTVVDLGQPYTLNTVDLQFANSGSVKVYVVDTEPDGEKSWTTLVGGIPPNGVFNTGANGSLTTPGQGQYLVIISDTDLGDFDGLGFAGSNANGDHVSVNVQVHQSGPNFTATTTITTTTGNGTTTTTTTTISTQPGIGHEFPGGPNNGHGPGQGGPLGETPKPPPVHNQSN